jgi:hypothetical protein
LASQQRRRRLPKPNTDSNSDSYAYSDSDSDSDTDTNSYSYTYIYRYSHANSNGDTYSDSYRGPEDHAYAKATTHPAAAPLSSKISWLDSQTRERKLASSCLWIEPTVLL